MGISMLYGYTVKNGREIVSRFPWDIGIVAFMIFPELMRIDKGVSDKLKPLIIDPFFDLIEMTPMDDAEWSRVEELNKNYRKRFALALQPYILTRGMNINAIDEAERSKAVEFIVNEIKRAGLRGMKAVGLCSGPNVEDPEKRKIAIDALVKSLVEIGAEASRYGMKVFLETFDVTWDRKRIAGYLHETVKIVERVRESVGNIYIMWDLSHAPLLNEDPEILKSYPEFIGHIHIGCGKKVGDKLLDTHPGFYRPGAINTENDVAKLLRVLHDMDYKGSISFEIRPEQDQDPFEVLNAGKGVLLRAFQLYLDSIL
uniref:Xylose isomerase-like TIM barrel domain-containing protein n=1 Tax=Ignisphaera aggregans TaxID=334771 RepID=A0A7C5XN78_9CREN